MPYTRRRFLGTNLAAMMAGFAPKLSVVSAKSPESPDNSSLRQVSLRDYWNDWPQFVTKQMNQAAAHRKKLIADVQTTQGVQKRAELVRDQIWQLLGGETTERTPLNERIVGTVDRPQYQILKVIFESLPGIYVTAHLYLPKKQGTFPGILAPLGHSPNGKLYRSYQHCFQNLARMGYVVLAYDPFGQGERRQYLYENSNQPRYDVTPEHLQAGRPMVLLGSGFARHRVWDGIRALDYLLSRPEVDANRIGCTGQSGGATITMYLMAIDPRIHVAVPVEGNFENLAGPSYQPPGAIADAEQDMVGNLPLGLDRGDLLNAFAPRPLRICYTVHDQGQTYSPVYEEAIAENVHDLRRFYGLFHATDKLDVVAGHLPHGLDALSRSAVYTWFNRWLRDVIDDVPEADFDTSPEGDLNCTKTGQVLTSFRGRTVTDLNVEWMKRLLPKSPFASGLKFEPAKDMVRSRLQQLLALPAMQTNISIATLSVDVGPKLRVEEFQCEPEPGIRTVGWHVSSVAAIKQRKPVMLFLSDRLVNDPLFEGGRFDEILHAGYAVCSINLRGSGISSPRYPSNGPVFYRAMNISERHAWANLSLGRSVIGQRVCDALAAIRFLRSRSDVDSSAIYVMGEGAAGLTALMTAVLDSEVKSLLLRDVIQTYQSVVSTEDYTLDLDWFVPGILRYFDLPDLVAATLPRPVWVDNPRNADGTLINTLQAIQIYRERLASLSLPASLQVHNTAVDSLAICLEWLHETSIS
jgi:cephalosporin-C deacetylase-like acetyl esterase